MLRRGDVAHMELFFGLEIAIDDISMEILFSYSWKFFRFRTLVINGTIFVYLQRKKIQNI